jgi:hypothetical protein
MKRNPTRPVKPAAVAVTVRPIDDKALQQVVGGMMAIIQNLK